MYEMYPDDWGHRRHRTAPADRVGTRPEGTRAVQSALDLRDNGGHPADDRADGRADSRPDHGPVHRPDDG